MTVTSGRNDETINIHKFLIGKHEDRINTQELMG